MTYIIICHLPKPIQTNRHVGRPHTFLKGRCAKGICLYSSEEVLWHLKVHDVSRCTGGMQQNRKEC